MNDQGHIYSPTISIGIVSSIDKHQNSFLAGPSGGDFITFLPVMVGVLENMYLNNIYPLKQDGLKHI
jgi:hypothetical protein